MCIKNISCYYKYLKFLLNIKMYFKNEQLNHDL